VNDTFGSLRGMWHTVRAMMFNRYSDRSALDLLSQPIQPVHSHNPLVQISASNDQLEETHA